MDDVPFIDKWTHLVMYGGTCTVMWIEYMRHHDRLHFWKLFLFAWLGPILMSGLLELLQRYCTTNRSGEWLDFAANTLGVALGCTAGLLAFKWRRRC
jgi:VanZ family protein